MGEGERGGGSGEDVEQSMRSQEGGGEGVEWEEAVERMWSGPRIKGGFDVVLEVTKRADVRLLVSFAVGAGCWRG